MIVVDSREPAFYYRQLKKKGANVVVKPLDYGDYLITAPGQPRVCVERKTARDLTASILDGRLWRQALGVKECEYPVVLVEGSLYEAVKWARIASSVVTGALSRLIAARVSVVSVPSKWWSVDFLYLLDRKVAGGDLAIVAKPSIEEKREGGWERGIALMNAVQSVPGIGRKTAKLIAEKYDSLAELIADGGARLIGVLSARKLKRLREALGIESTPHRV